MNDACSLLLTQLTCSLVDIMSVYIRRSTHVFFLVLFLACVSHAQVVVPGGAAFFDTFDGTSSVNWARGAWSGADHRIEGGSLEILDTRPGGYSVMAPVNSSNQYLGYDNSRWVFSTEAQITKQGGGNNVVGLLVRSASFSGYLGEINDNGQLRVFELFEDGSTTTLGTADSSIDPVANNVVLEFATEGDSLDFRVWEAATDPPELAHLSITDDTYPWGTFGVYAGTTGGSASAEFQWASAIVPEPSSDCLYAGAILGLAIMRRRRNWQRTTKS